MQVFPVVQVFQVVRVVNLRKSFFDYVVSITFLSSQFQWLQRMWCWREGLGIRWCLTGTTQEKPGGGQIEPSATCAPRAIWNQSHSYTHHIHTYTVRQSDEYKDTHKHTLRARCNHYCRRVICYIFYTSKIPKFVNITQEKRINCDIFRQTFLISHVRLCEDFSLNSASIAHGVMFCAYSWQSLPSPKIFYKKVICDFFLTNSTSA